MRIGSLFSGIGGLELGLERAGVGHTVWQVEKDDFCQQVLMQHWSDTVIYDDVTTVDWRAVEPVEVLCGGFPCQDISIAGSGAGLEGESSGLWAHFAEAVRVLRPRYVVVENSPALPVRGLGDVLADLAGCGYDAEWDCVPAASVGSRHLRARTWIVAYPSRVGNGVEEEAVQPGWPGPVDCGWWASEPGLVRVADGVPDRVDRLKALGNAVVPQVAEHIGRRILALEGVAA